MDCQGKDQLRLSEQVLRQTRAFGCSGAAESQAYSRRLASTRIIGVMALRDPQSGAQRSPRTSLLSSWLICLARRQPQPQVIVHDFLETLARAAGLTLQLGLHIIIQCQCRAHISTLSRRHRDAMLHSAGRNPTCQVHGHGDPIRVVFHQ